jgi:hypothetical protein
MPRSVCAALKDRDIFNTCSSYAASIT